LNILKVQIIPYLIS